MRELIKLFAQLALLRRGPQDLPASTLLLVVTILAYLGVNSLVSLQFPPARNWPPQLLLDAAFMLIWYVLLLRLARHPERTLQTATAVFGYQIVLAPLLVTLQWLVQRLHGNSAWETPLEFAGLVLLIWLVAANSRIVSAALEWPMAASVSLVVLQTVVGELLQLAIFIPSKS
jgi:hypothetical protein